MIDTFDAEDGKYFKNASQNLNKNQKKIVSGINPQILLQNELTLENINRIQMKICKYITDLQTYIEKINAGSPNYLLLLNTLDEIFRTNHR